MEGARVWDVIRIRIPDVLGPNLTSKPCRDPAICQPTETNEIARMIQKLNTEHRTQPLMLPKHYRKAFWGWAMVLVILLVQLMQQAYGIPVNLRPVKRPDADLPHMLPFGEEYTKGRRKCMRRPDRAPTAQCTVHVLDLSDLARLLGLPRCREADFVVDPLEGMVVPHPRFLGKQGKQKPANWQEQMYPHQYSAHSQSHWAGPWFAKQVLETGGNADATLESADTVYVYDYCYIMKQVADSSSQRHWLLKDIYNGTRGQGEVLLKLYRGLLNLPRWKSSGGRDFVFYHSYPGLSLGSEQADASFASAMCNNFQWATLLATEQGQRWYCPSYNPRTTALVPYSFKDVSVGAQVASNSARPYLLFFRGNCYTKKAGNIGLVLRRAVAQGLRVMGDDDMDVCCSGADAPAKVACTDTNFRQNPQRTQPQPELLADMAQAQFCLVMPGNTQSSGHLADAFFTGCIPVFLGPPFHTLPFPHLIDYSAVGVFLNASLMPLPWWPKTPGLTFEPALKPQASVADRGHPKWWFADAPKVELRTLTGMEEIAGVLRGYSKQEVARKRAALLDYRHLFTFNEKPTFPVAASDVVVELMCTYAKHSKRRRRRAIVPHPPIPSGY